jgi:hypothetical protein
LKDVEDISELFGRDKSEEIGEIVFTDFHDKIEVEDVRLLKFNN